MKASRKTARLMRNGQTKRFRYDLKEGTTLMIKLFNRGLLMLLAMTVTVGMMGQPVAAQDQPVPPREGKFFDTDRNLIL